MASGDTYIHGTTPSEQERLLALNRLTNAAFVRFLDIRPGARVLEVGSGLGLLAAEAARAGAGRVVGVERSTEQLAAAVRMRGVEYVQGDAHRLEFEDATFDLAYARFLLEHVADPLQVLREMRRVLTPGGRVAVCENDVSLLRLDPPCPAFERVWTVFQAHQRLLGGDALIGRRLYGLLGEAGFANVELSVQPEVHWQGSPGFVPWVKNLVGNVEGAADALVDAGRCEARDLEAALQELARFEREPRASSTFMWHRARGER